MRSPAAGCRPCIAATSLAAARSRPCHSRRPCLWLFQLLPSGHEALIRQVPSLEGTCLVELNAGDTSSECYLNSSLCHALKYHLYNHNPIRVSAKGAANCRG
ncbi:unnamed protein product [Urochloa humidicola]